MVYVKLWNNYNSEIVSSLFQSHNFQDSLTIIVLPLYMGYDYRAHTIIK